MGHESGPADTMASLLRNADDGFLISRTPSYTLKDEV